MSIGLGEKDVMSDPCNYRTVWSKKRKHPARSIRDETTNNGNYERKRHVIRICLYYDERVISYVSAYMLCTRMTRRGRCLLIGVTEATTDEKRRRRVSSFFALFSCLLNVVAQSPPLFPLNFQQLIHKTITGGGRGRCCKISCYRY